MYGASGRRTAAVQLVRHSAPTSLPCADENVEVVRSLGPTRSSTTLQDDFTKTARRTTSSSTRSAICSGAAALAEPGGMYLSTDLGCLWHVPLLAPGALARSRRSKFPAATRRSRWSRSGADRGGEYRAVIDRRYPLDEVVEATATSRPSRRPATSPSRPLLSLSLRLLGEVAPARPDEHVPSQREVGDLNPPLRDPDQRSVAAIRGSPFRPTNRRSRIAPTRAVASLSPSPRDAERPSAADWGR